MATTGATVARIKPLPQPALFSFDNPPVKAPVPVVEISAPTGKGISPEERALCIELIGHDREEITCSLCGEVFLIFTWHLRTCPLSGGGVGSTRLEAPQIPTVSAPQGGLEIEPLPNSRPLLGDDWVGHATTCHLCGKLVPTARHLDLIHDPHGEGLRGRLLSAYLWPEHARGAEVLDLEVEDLRRLILCGGYPEREAELARLANGQRELSPNSDPTSLTSAHPYKGKGVKDGAAMAPDRWRGK